MKVVRGGSWLVDQRDGRASYRSGDFPSVRGFSVGFRVVVVPSGDQEE